MNFAEKIKYQEEEGKKEGIASQSGGGWYKFVEGTNMFRVLSEPEMIFEKYKVGICYTDCGYEGGARMMTYVLDRKDNKIKIAKLPYSLGTAIAGYQTDVEFGNDFEEFPMPYDIRVIAKGAGSKEVEYKIDPSPKKVPVDSEILEQLSKLKSIPDVISKMKENQKEKHMQDGTFQANQERKTKLKEELDGVRGKSVDDGYPTRESEGMGEEDIL